MGVWGGVGVGGGREFQTRGETWLQFRPRPQGRNPPLNPQALPRFHHIERVQASAGRNGTGGRTFLALPCSTLSSCRGREDRGCARPIPGGRDPSRHMRHFLREATLANVHRGHTHWANTERSARSHSLVSALEATPSHGTTR